MMTNIPLAALMRAVDAAMATLEGLPRLEKIQVLQCCLERVDPEKPKPGPVETSLKRRPAESALEFLQRTANEPRQEVLPLVRPSRRRQFSEEEDATLGAAWCKRDPSSHPVYTIKQLAQTLLRSESSIRSRLVYLGLIPPRCESERDRANAGERRAVNRAINEGAGDASS